MAAKNKGGRPSKFEQMKPILLKLAAKGFTDTEMGEVIGVTERTINNWKKKDPEFFQSLKIEKHYADEEVVESLFNKAKGHTKTITKTFKVKDYKEVGGQYKQIERLETAEEEMYIPPDTTAGIFWLKNRRPDKWRDKQEVHQTTETIVVGDIDDE